MVQLVQQLTLPDLWQQEAVHALRQHRDVVVHAPTGAGKTYIFELLYPELRGQAVYTVPTRALANDKLAEWQTRGWDVGISTGDLSHRLDAKVVVATLETQKGKLLQRRGPALLVIDEYQMLADPIRGVNYELAIALAPAETQLLLLSGSVANPEEIVAWLQRLGRQATLVSHAERPVPLLEVDLHTLPGRAPEAVRNPWPRYIYDALHAGLDPVLLFAPRRQAAEELAQQIAAALPMIHPLPLSLEQQQLAGPKLSKLLRARVAYHHSGLSYAQRAGLIEPLAKAGELRAVVATMGLAAGINFSMRSVAITGTTYLAGPFEREVRPDELLQMYGRAGRRGLDDTGYALISSRPPRLLDARARRLKRSPQLDWPTSIAVMQAAVQNGETPFAAALHLNTRLFSPTPIPLGIEHSLETGPMPCGLEIDMDRARLAHRAMHKSEREFPIGRRERGRLVLAPWLRKATQQRELDLAALQRDLLPRLSELTGGGRIVKMEPRAEELVALVSFAHTFPCPACPQLGWCSTVPIVQTAVQAWRQLGLITAQGFPTPRGLIFSHFQHGEGLAIAAAIEDESYDIEALLFDLANLRGGPRFAAEDVDISGRLSITCQKAYGRATHEGYLDSGIPPDYAPGASETLRALLKENTPRQKLLGEQVRAGDLERALLEWRSLLRQIDHATPYEIPRWRALQSAAAEWLERSPAPGRPQQA